MTARPISTIAREIRKEWHPVWFGAKPYLEAMLSLNSVDESYGWDSGKSIVLYFLGNAAQFKGDTARRIKAELKEACGVKLTKKERDILEAWRNEQGS